ncbi:MAG: hypothetical protein FJ095_02665 [Deltaproteobacteria bacterium]|nr:hypothetical protein [Deltaproteobacteria bacterium]
MRLRPLLLVLFVGCAPATASCPKPLQVDARPFDGGPLLAEPVARAERLGAVRAELLVAKVANEDEEFGRFLTVSQDRCVAVVARTGSSLRDIDAFVFDEAGDLLAADEAPSSGAAVMVCPPHPERLYVALRVMSGMGMVGVAALDVPPAAADAVARALEVRGRPGQDTGKLAAWPGLEARLRARRQALGGTWEDIRRVEVPLDPHAPTIVSTVVESGRCVDAFVLGDEGVASFAFDVVDSRGRAVAHGRGVGAEQSATLCAVSPQSVAFELLPRGAIGRAALILGRSNVGASRELALRSDVVGLESLLHLDGALEAHRARTAGLALGSATRAGEGTAMVGRVASIPVTTPQGCSRLDVVGGAPLGRFLTELWSPEGRLLDASEGGASSPLFRCSLSPEALRVEVSALGEPGPFVVELRSGGIPDPVLTEAPVVTSRLLQELDSPLSPAEPRAAVGAVRIDLEAQRALERPMAFPAGCSRWRLAADSSVSLAGELFLPSEANARALYGSGSLSTEVCTKVPLVGRLRVRASATTVALSLVTPRDR